MQTQDAPAEFLFKLWPWLETNKNRLIGAAAALLLAIGVYYFIASQHEENEIAAGQAMTQLLVMPAAGTAPGQAADALVALAAKYPGTAAAQRSLLQGAASMFAAGRYPDAAAQFQKSFDGNSSGPLAATALLGVAASLEAQGKLEPAAAAYQKVAANFSGTPSALPALCSLGRIAEEQGKPAEALNHYESAARAGNLGGSLAQMAALRAAELKTRLAAMPKTTPPTTPSPVPAK